MSLKLRSNIAPNEGKHADESCTEMDSLLSIRTLPNFEAESHLLGSVLLWEFYQLFDSTCVSFYLLYSSMKKDAIFLSFYFMPRN